MTGITPEEPHPNQLAACLLPGGSKCIRFVAVRQQQREHTAVALTRCCADLPVRVAGCQGCTVLSRGRPWCSQPILSLAASQMSKGSQYSSVERCSQTHRCGPADCRPVLYAYEDTRLSLNSKVALERLELPTRGLGRRRACAVWPEFRLPARIAGVIVCS